MKRLPFDHIIDYFRKFGTLSVQHASLLEHFNVQVMKSCPGASRHIKTGMEQTIMHFILCDRCGSVGCTFAHTVYIAARWKTHDAQSHLFVEERYNIRDGERSLLQNNNMNSESDPVFRLSCPTYEEEENYYAFCSS